MTTYIIIGNGVAGNAAAEAIRKHDQNGAISIFARGEYPFYYVPGLPAFIAGEKDERSLIIHDRDWYAQHRLDLHLATGIAEILPDEMTVVTEQGERYRYDKLLIATGGTALVPPITGAELPGVVTLRTLGDAKRIKEQIPGAKGAVLIGGGLLGLEAGNGLRKAGLAVTVVEIFPRLLPRQMDVPGAAMLQRQMEQMGFSFVLGAKVKQIKQVAGGLGVELEGGEVLPGDVVLISAGVRPELALARAAGLAVDRGVKVDDQMRTGREEIYAAGDLIEHRGRFYGLWPAAQEQGRVAGAAMAGQEVSYEGTVPSSTLKVVGIDLFSAGDIDAEGKLTAVVAKDEARNIYRKLVSDGRAVVGAILLGDIRGSGEIAEAIRTRKDMAALKNDLAGKGLEF